MKNTEGFFGRWPRYSGEKFSFLTTQTFWEFIKKITNTAIEVLEEKDLKNSRHAQIHFENLKKENLIPIQSWKNDTKSYRPDLRGRWSEIYLVWDVTYMYVPFRTPRTGA